MTLFWFTDQLRQRNITDLEQMATELLRVHLTRRELQRKYGSTEPPDESTLYRIMKEKTEPRLGYFPGDEKWFAELFVAGKDLDLSEEIRELFRKDRSGVVITPKYLVDYFSRTISSGHVETVLIPEAHKHLNSLADLIDSHPDKRFFLTAEKKWLVELLKFLFETREHVEVIHVSIYAPLDFEQAFDSIIAFPVMGNKPEIDTGRFITRESDGIAIENLLGWLGEHGEMQIIVPARVTFSGGAFARLRSWIVKHFSVKALFELPEGTLRPYTGIKTYLLTITRQPVDEVQLGRFEMQPPRFQPVVEKTIPAETLAEREDWRMELLLQDRRHELLNAFSGSGRRIVKLKEIAELFRGKSILKSHIQPGDISVLNISNIEDGEILWDEMDTIDEEYRKVQRYALEKGDVAITCRGTVNKVAFVRELPKKAIASANIIVIRVTDPGVLSEYIKIFLESPVGTRLVQSFQRGTTVMNIHPSDLGEMEIPLLELEEQEKLVNEYREELKLYRTTVKRARERWDRIREEIYKQLIE